MKLTASLLLLALAAPAFAAKPKLPPYATSIRCSGLAEAAARREGKGVAFGRTNYDAAIFWGMAASERARKDGISGARFTADQEAAASKAGAELDAGSAAAAAELARCISRVPPLKPKRK
jgi:dihydroxyacetone kinase